MPTLKLQFPGGRYHATPWGHHVNEGLIEWPPSPWRLLRALIACGFSSQSWSEVPPTARQLVDKLAGVLPFYRLPDATAAHSRHFMPVGRLKNGCEETTLVFDTWANVGRGELVVHWPCELDDEEGTLMRRLATALGYLGRSESWVEAELLIPGESTLDEFNATPCQDGEQRGRGWEQVFLMAPLPLEDYRRWRGLETEAVLAPFPLPEGRRKPTAKLLRDREKAEAPYPADLVSCLTKDTVWWKQYGWSQPPGSRRVLYWRRSDALQVAAFARTVRQRPTPVTAMLLSLTTPSGNKSALPPCTRTLPQAELFHRAIVGKAGQGQSVDCSVLTGKDTLNRPLRSNHAHAHVWPVDLDDDGRLDHLLLYAKMGFCDDAQRAIRSLRRTWTKRGVDEIQVAVAGSGELDILRQLPPKLRMNIEMLLGPGGGSRVWESFTPFVPPRIIKPRGKNILLGQVNAELASRGLPAASDIQVDEDLTRKLRHHVRRRTHGGGPPFSDVGFGLRLVFSEPVCGPFALGYASHFGLGLFRSICQVTRENLARVTPMGKVSMKAIKNNQH